MKKMQEIVFKVTANSLKQVQKEDKWHQAQIAIVGTGFQATSVKRQEIIIGGVIKLIVGDSHAIWHSHNIISERQKKDFESLFSLLANHPDKNVSFLYEISDNLDD
ncbi:MAG: hypothetical protein N2A40_02665 [Desulfobulbaceae bacterium]